MPTTTPTADLDAVKARQHRAWSSGDYAVISSTLQITGELLCETVDIAAGERVLDVAAGNGNTSLAAARRGAVVTAADYVPALLERTRARAAADGLSVDVREADAEALPFADASFDVVLSTFGVMFAPRQEQVMAELLRVCRPGGRIGLANWTPDSFVGRMFRVMGRYVPSPEGVRSPVEWGTRARVGALFGTDVESIAVREREFVLRYRSAQHWLDTFRDWYGPTHNAFAVLGPADRIALERDLVALAEVHNTSEAGALRIPSEYIEVIAVKPR